MFIKLLENLERLHAGTRRTLKFYTEWCQGQNRTHNLHTGGSANHCTNVSPPYATMHFNKNLSVRTKG